MVSYKEDSSSDSETDFLPNESFPIVSEARDEEILPTIEREIKERDFLQQLNQSVRGVEGLEAPALPDSPGVPEVFSPVQVRFPVNAPELRPKPINKKCLTTLKTKMMGRITIKGSHSSS